MAATPSPSCNLDELNRVNEEIERFDISDNADRLEEMEEMEGFDIESMVEKQIFGVLWQEIDFKVSYHKVNTVGDLRLPTPPLPTYHMNKPGCEASVIRVRCSSPLSPLPIKVKKETVEVMED